MIIVNTRKREYFWVGWSAKHYRGTIYDSGLRLLLEHSGNLAALVDKSLRRGLGILPRIAARWFGDPIVVVGDYVVDYDTWRDVAQVDITAGVEWGVVEESLLYYVKEHVDICEVYGILTVRLGEYPLNGYGKCVEWVETRCGTRICIARRDPLVQPPQSLTDSIASLLGSLFI